MDLITLMDWALFVGGLLGFVGTLLRWRFFMDAQRMETLINMLGETRVRALVAALYLLLGLLGARNVFGV
ncbi:MAG: hypothetical protein M5U29_09125 [Anaerolineae bacterium]|nr:hypothetical protein [Anaerolineae bacterium]